MSIYEYDEEAVKKVWWDEAYAEGYAKGYAEGYAEGYAKGYAEGCQEINQLYLQLIEADRMDDIKRTFSDKAFREQLLREMKEKSD